MNAKELKLGDWVSLGGENMKVLAMGMFMVTLVDKGGNVIGPISYDEIKPIPITEEILEKNGWRGLREPGSPYSKNRLLLEHVGNLDERIWRVYLFDSTDHMSVTVNFIKYVHELQHILWAVRGLRYSSTGE